MMQGWLGCLMTVFCSGILEEEAGTVNREALLRRQRKRLFAAAAPAGCKEGSSGWCAIEEKGTRLRVRNAKRLGDLLNTLAKRESTVASLEPSGCDVAARALDAAVGVATRGFRAEHGDARAPAEFRCRKKGADLATLEYWCSVSESRVVASDATDEETEQADASGAESAAKPAQPAAVARETDAALCVRLSAWHARRTREADDDDAAFFGWLAAEHADLGLLTKVWLHVSDARAADKLSAKARDALKARAHKLYKKLSKELHPDKLRVRQRCAHPPKTLDQLVDMVQAIFDRVKTLSDCVARPLRCELPRPSPEALKKHYTALFKKDAEL